MDDRSIVSGQRPVKEMPPLNPRLGRMRFLSRLLDNSIPLPGGYRIGLDPLLGLLPGAGDFLASTLSVWLLYDAARLGLPKRALLQMAINILVETVVGVVPVLGDLFDAAWKANARNMRIVEMHYSPALKERKAGHITGAFILTLLLFYGALFAALWAMASLIMRLFS